MNQKYRYERAKTSTSLQQAKESQKKGIPSKRKLNG